MYVYKKIYRTVIFGISVFKQCVLFDFPSLGYGTCLGISEYRKETVYNGCVCVGAG